MIKTALTAAIVLATASAAFATEFDGNLANRYAGFAGASMQSMQTRNVALAGQSPSRDRPRGREPRRPVSHRLRRAIRR